MHEKLYLYDLQVKSGKAFTRRGLCSSSASHHQADLASQQTKWCIVWRHHLQRPRTLCSLCTTRQMNITTNKAMAILLVLSYSYLHTMLSQLARHSPTGLDTTITVLSCNPYQTK
jgi:hypothetical protein